MGLRTASVRHPHVEVMAPALTETNQTRSLKLSSSESASPVNGVPKSNNAFIVPEELPPVPLTNGKQVNNVFENLNTLALATEILNGEISLVSLNQASDKQIMNNSSLSMGDLEENMGLQKTTTVDDLLKTEEEVEQLLKGKNEADVEELIQNLTQNEEDLMRVIKSMEGSTENLCSAEEVDPMFPISTSELMGNLTNFEKELFNDDDVLNISIEDQLIAQHNNIEEIQTKEILAEAVKKQDKLQRRIDNLLRRTRVFQVRHMGQHASREIAGVFEHVHRLLKRCKESSSFPPSMAQEENTDSNQTETSNADILKPITQSSAKNLVKKLEMTSILQANNSQRLKTHPKYFGSGSLDVSSTFRPPTTSGLTTLTPWDAEHKKELQNIAGSLETQIKFVQDEVDSEATDSSSGGDSCDEMQTYNNPFQQFLPIQKRALWKFSKDRAGIASRWTWLQSQISDLEYRIRQFNELYRKQRQSKDSVKLGGASPPHSVPSSPSCVNGYRGQLPGGLVMNPPATDASSSIQSCSDYQCARTRPFNNLVFKKRKILQVNGLHLISKKAARPATVRCDCIYSETLCVICTGRVDPMEPRDAPDYLSRNERLALLDPSYHPVFSLNEDACASLYMEAITKTTEWQQRSSRANLKPMKYADEHSEESNSVPLDLDHRPRKNEQQRKKYTKLIKPSSCTVTSGEYNKNRHARGRKSTRGGYGYTKKRSRLMSRPSMSDGADDELEGIAGSSGKYDSPSTSPLLPTQSVSKKNRNNDSYDIDNIIIPYSVAASTRMEKLQYKEILTPKWRIAEKFELKNNGVVKTSQESQSALMDVWDYQINLKDEDLSEDAVVIRHEKSEIDEKKKFLSYLRLPIGYGRSRANRRTDSIAESSGANTPDRPLSPAPMVNTEVAEKEEMPSLASPPATPFTLTEHLSSISGLRRRTVSQTRSSLKDESRSNTPDHVEVLPYDKRMFPLGADMYEVMINSMPDDHKMLTNARSQDSSGVPSPKSLIEEKDHDSESTESAFEAEDPNDPEWDLDRVKDQYK